MSERVDGDEDVHTVADLGRLLRGLRRREARRQGRPELTYRELAAKTGWSYTIIGRYLGGEILPPTDRFDVLVQLLGASPGEQGALATIRDRVEELRRTGTVDKGQIRVVVPRGLPAPVTHFIGRQDELRALSRLPPTHVAVIGGTAGVGKTALAVYWAHQVADRFPDGQVYLNLRGFDPGGQVMGPAEALRCLLDALHVSAHGLPADLDARANLYRTLLAGKRALILLDNARDSGQVRPLLPGTAGCLVLVTSRTYLSGLVADGAHPLTVDLLSHAEARDLLTRRLGPDQVATDPEAVADIVRRCARLPLALTIVAARAAARSRPGLAALAAELRDSRGRWATLTGDDPATDVRAVLSWSYRALTPDAARLFRLLGVHCGPSFSVPAAASLAGFPVAQVRSWLTELADASLIIESSPDRYTFHDLLRAYATEQAHAVEPDAERQAAIARMLDHYLHTACDGARLLNPARDPLHLTAPRPDVSPEPLADHRQAMAWFTAEHPVLLAATHYAASTGFDGHTWQLAWALWPFLDRRGHWSDESATGSVALAAARRLADRTGQAHAHRILAHSSIRLGRFDDALKQLERVLDLHVQAGDLNGQAHGHHALAHLWQRQDRYPEALTHAAQALDLYRAAGHRHGQALAQGAVGWFHTLLSHHELAIVHCAQALALHQELDDRDGQANTWDGLGHAHHHLGQHAQAVACYQRALDLYGDLGNRYGQAETLSHLGDTHSATGDAPAAREAWHQALTILDDLDHPDADRVRQKLHAAIRDA
jgi:hypothetical protein